MRRILLVIAILVVQMAQSCKFPKQENPVDIPKKIKMISKNIKIDDKVIDTRDPMAVIDPLWWLVSIYDSKEQYEKDLKPFSLHQRAVFAIMWYMGEVNNGGHSQFYSNSTGIVWEDAMNGFELVGLKEGKSILEESAKRFGTSPSFDRKKRETALDLLNENFDDLDSRFYKLDSSINITERIADYIQANKKAFYFEGKVEIPEK
jgi:Domain of unknown function (DUF4375)